MATAIWNSWIRDKDWFDIWKNNHYTELPDMSRSEFIGYAQNKNKKYLKSMEENIQFNFPILRVSTDGISLRKYVVCDNACEIFWFPAGTTVSVYIDENHLCADINYKGKNRHEEFFGLTERCPVVNGCIPDEIMKTDAFKDVVADKQNESDLVFTLGNYMMDWWLKWYDENGHDIIPSVFADMISAGFTLPTKEAVV